MASDKAQSASTIASELQRRVNERFGVLPNFFRLSPETPEITEKLWGFAQAAYLDNPLPSVFKERLFVDGQVVKNRTTSFLPFFMLKCPVFQPQRRVASTI
jgi:hypothetical protein